MVRCNQVFWEISRGVRTARGCKTHFLKNCVTNNIFSYLKQKQSCGNCVSCKLVRLCVLITNPCRDFKLHILFRSSCGEICIEKCYERNFAHDVVCDSLRQESIFSRAQVSKGRARNADIPISRTTIFSAFDDTVRFMNAVW